MKPILCNHLLNIANDRFCNRWKWNQLESQKILQTFSTCSSPIITHLSVINVEVMRGYQSMMLSTSMQDHTRLHNITESVCYKKADYHGIKDGLRQIHQDMSARITSSIETLWQIFKPRLNGLLNAQTPTKTLQGRKVRTPWIDRKVKTAMHQQCGTEIAKLEAVKRRSARWATRDYQRTYSVTQMLQDLNWRTLEQQ